MTIETAIKLVQSGKSSIWQNWHSNVSSITMEEFIKELEWLYDDPNFTKELGCSKFDGLVRLRRIRDKNGSFVGFYREDNSHLWGGWVSLNCRDKL